MASLDFDVFDSDSGVDDAVIGIIYTFTPSPEPTGFSQFAIGLLELLHDVEEVSSGALATKSVRLSMSRPNQQKQTK